MLVQGDWGSICVCADELYLYVERLLEWMVFFYLNLVGGRKLSIDEMKLMKIESVFVFVLFFYNRLLRVSSVIDSLSNLQAPAKYEQSQCHQQYNNIISSFFISTRSSCFCFNWIQANNESSKKCRHRKTDKKIREKNFCRLCCGVNWETIFEPAIVWLTITNLILKCVSKREKISTTFSCKEKNSNIFFSLPTLNTLTSSVLAFGECKAN